jgi:hypothetical protein
MAWGNGDSWGKPNTVKLTLPEMMVTVDKPYEIEIIPVGDLGVYWDNDMWRIIHIPTLARFDRAIPILEPQDKDKLMEWCRLVQADCRDDWMALASLDQDNYKDGNVELRQRIMRHCQMVDMP